MHGFSTTQPNESLPAGEWHFAGREPSIEQLLADPIMQQLMRKDTQDGSCAHPALMQPVSSR